MLIIYITYLKNIVVQNLQKLLGSIVDQIKIKHIVLLNFQLLVYLALTCLDQCFMTQQAEDGGLAHHLRTDEVKFIPVK
jgi:hypothetical protein